MYITRKMQFWILRFLAFAILLGVSSLECAATELKFDCAANEVEPQMTLHYSGESLTVKDDKTNTTLVGSFMGSPTEFHIQCSGPMEAMMPDLAAFDGCLAAGLKKQKTTAQDIDTLTYVEVNCRSEVKQSATLQKIQGSVSVTSDPSQPGMAFLDIERDYLTASTVTGKPLALVQWPPLRSCSFVMVP